jgi:large subunit ribosomal protein L25
MDATLEVVRRDGRGKNEARRLRVTGQIPAVLYGGHKAGEAPQGVSVAVDPKAVLQILRSESGVNTLISLKLDGADARVMVRDYQVDPVTDQLLHADFYQLRMDRVMTATVPVLLKGEAQGVKLQGGMVDFVTREIEVECLPTDIPEHINLDVSDLMLNDGIRVRDLPSDPKWTPLVDGSTLLVHVVMPKAEESAQAAEEEEGVEETPDAEGAEPDAAKKGKADSDDDEKSEKKKKK